MWRRWHAAQLNESEYVGAFLPVMLFFHLKGIDSPLASGLALCGQISYFWGRFLIGHVNEGGVFPPPYAPGAAMRYAAMGLMGVELLGVVSKE